MEAYFHGAAKAWSNYGVNFGREAVQSLAADPGIEAYSECALTMGGRKVPGHQEWIRVRASTDGDQAQHPIFKLPAGTPVQVQRIPGPEALTAKPASSKVKKGVLQAVVLMSHPHGIVVNVDLPLLKKLKAAPGSWYLISLGGSQFPILHRRGIGFDREQEVWDRPTALLYDFEAHWVYEKITVMRLKPMQMNWRGKYPDATEVTIPTAPIGGEVTIIVEPPR